MLTVLSKDGMDVVKGCKRSLVDHCSLMTRVATLWAMHLAIGKVP